MTILGKFFHWAAGVPAWITGALNSVDAEAKIVLPVTINAVEALKTIMSTDNKTVNAIDGIIEIVAPTAVSSVIDKLRAAINIWAPVLLLKLKDANAIANLPNLQIQLNSAISELNFSSDTAKQLFYNDFAAVLFTEMTTGKTTLIQAKVLVQEAYDAFKEK